MRHLVPPEARGQRLDQHLALALPELTRSRIRSLLEAGHIQLGGHPAKPAYRVRGGEEVTVVVPPPIPARPQPEALSLSVLYEDRDLLVLDKAPGMVVHPGAGHASGTLVNALLHHVEDLGGVGGELRPGIVHRLDKETSGCLVVAKNDSSLERLQKAFHAREVDKRYQALVHGVPPPHLELDTFYGRHPRYRQRFTGKLKAGKRARTSVWTHEAFGDAARLEVILHTGRTHQIRVHLSEFGHPLLGDVLYGGIRKGDEGLKVIQKDLGRQALHAWKLSFAHPRTGKPLSFEAPLPSDFAAALAALRRRRA